MFQRSEIKQNQSPYKRALGLISGTLTPSQCDIAPTYLIFVFLLLLFHLSKYVRLIVLVCRSKAIIKINDPKLVLNIIVNALLLVTRHLTIVGGEKRFPLDFEWERTSLCVWSNVVETLQNG